MIPWWAVDVLAGAGAAFIWCLILAGVVLTLRWASIRRGQGDRIAPQTPAPGPRSMPGAGSCPGEGLTAGPQPVNAVTPSPGSCRWCDGTGIAVVFDSLMEDAYPIPCPGACPEPGRQL